MFNNLGIEGIAVQKLCVYETPNPWRGHPVSQDSRSRFIVVAIDVIWKGLAQVLPNMNTAPCLEQKVEARLKFADRRTDKRTDRRKQDVPNHRGRQAGFWKDRRSDWRTDLKEHGSDHSVRGHPCN